MLTDRSFSAEDATAALSLAGVALIFGRFSSGFAMDRIFVPYLTIFFFICPMIGIVLLVFGGSVGTALVGAILLGAAIGADIDLMPFLIGRYFGPRHFGQIYGVVFGLFMVGNALGIALLGIGYDRTGSYRETLLFFEPLLVLSCSLLLGLGPYAFPAKTNAALSFQRQPLIFEKRNRSMIIDFHVHILEPEVYKITREQNVFTGFGTQKAPDFGRGSVYKEMTDVQTQLERMDKAGIDHAILSAATVLQSSSWADPKTDLELCQRTNNFIYDWVCRYPERFGGSMVLPLQDMNASLEEMRRCADDLSMRVIQMPTHVNGRYLGEPELRPLWQAVSDRSLVSFIHPEGIKDLWFQKYRLWNSVGQPIEEAKCIASMIYEGLLDEFNDLKIVLAHGGGVLPHNMARMDRNVEHMPETMKNISRHPSDYLRHFYYDTCIYDPIVAGNLIRRVGSDRFVLGSDYPVGEMDPIGFVESITELSEAERVSIKGGIALKILDISNRDD